MFLTSFWFLCSVAAAGGLAFGFSTLAAMDAAGEPPDDGGKSFFSWSLAACGSLCITFESGVFAASPPPAGFLVAAAWLLVAFIIATWLKSWWKAAMEDLQERLRAYDIGASNE